MTVCKKHAFGLFSILAQITDPLAQCFSTFFLQRNLPEMFAQLMEPYAMIQVSILLQPHGTVVANFVPGKLGLFRRNPLAATRGEQILIF